MVQLAYLGAVLAVFAWGTFAVPMKAPAVARANLDPVVFQVYMSFGIAIASALLLALPELRHAASALTLACIHVHAHSHRT
jgi:hypothetical protein